MKIPLAYVICLVGMILWIGLAEAKTPYKTLSDAGRWAFILGLAGVIWFYGGNRIL